MEEGANPQEGESDVGSRLRGQSMGGGNVYVMDSLVLARWLMLEWYLGGVEGNSFQ